MIAKLSLALLIAFPAFAHHSLAATYDISKMLTFKGVVASVLFRNPHCYLEVDFKDENGVAARWAFDTAAAGMLAAHGWNKDTVKTGDQVTIIGYGAKSIEHRGAARKLVMADGREFDCADRFAGNKDIP